MPFPTARPPVVAEDMHLHVSLLLLASAPLPFGPGTRIGISALGYPAQRTHAANPSGADDDARLAPSLPLRFLSYPSSTWTGHVRATDTHPAHGAASAVVAAEPLPGRRRGRHAPPPSLLCAFSFARGPHAREILGGYVQRHESAMNSPTRVRALLCCTSLRRVRAPAVMSSVSACPSYQPVQTHGKRRGGAMESTLGCAAPPRVALYPRRPRPAGIEAAIDDAHKIGIRL